MLTMRFFWTSFLLCSLLVLRNGAEGLALCMCMDGGIELQTADEWDCCADDTSTHPREGITAQHGPTCTDCFVVAFPSDSAKPTLPPAVANGKPGPVSPAFSAGVLPSVVCSVVPVFRVQTRVETALSHSRTVVLRR